MNRIPWISVAGLAGALFIGAFQPAGAATNLVQNGSFEYNPQYGCRIATTIIHRWTITSGNVDIGSVSCWGIAAPAGQYWLDLVGSAVGGSDVGTIAQSVPTVIGRSYRLSFYFGGNPQCLDTAVKSMNVLLNGVVVGTYSMNVANVAPDNAQWQRGTIIFAAQTSPTVLSFQALDVKPFTVCGALLDDIGIFAIPKQ